MSNLIARAARRALTPCVVVAALTASVGADAKNIVETAKASGEFATLLKLLATAAGMDKTLIQPGPYTVFAPTDAAFAAAPTGTVEMLMKPENKAMLKKVLGYHTVFGRLGTGGLDRKKSAVVTTNGQPVVLEGKDGTLMVNDARLSKPDIAADNGVIHVIDKVLLPPQPVQPRT